MNEKQDVGKKGELTIEEQNKKLKIAIKIMFAIVIIMFFLVGFNMVQLHGLKEIEKGDYITVQDCDRKYSMENMFDLGLEITEASINGTGIDER
jgi:hypothetical protein